MPSCDKGNVFCSCRGLLTAKHAEVLQVHVGHEEGLVLEDASARLMTIRKNVFQVRPHLVYRCCSYLSRITFTAYRTPWSFTSIDAVLSSGAQYVLFGGPVVA